MFNANCMFSSKTDLWSTPDYIFSALDQEFHFDVDVCATPENAKCSIYYTKETDGLSQKWDGLCCWCNPPYGRGIYKWVEKAFCSSVYCGSTVVMLLPARTDTQWFHKFIYKFAEIRFIRGRLKFGNSSSPAPFPSMVVVFRSKGDKPLMASQ